MLFRLGGLRLALPAREVVAIEKSVSSLDCPLGGGIVAGFHRFRACDCPVIDLTRLLGLSPTTSGCMVLVESGGYRVAFNATAMLAIEHLDPATFGRVPDALAAASGYLIGTTAARTGDSVTVLDAGAIAQATGTPIVAAAETSEENFATSRERLHLLIYKAGGGYLASRLSQLEAVFLLPEGFQDLRAADRVLAGACTRQGISVQLVSLAQLLGRKSSDMRAGVPVLLIRSDAGNAIGLMVDSVDFLQFGDTNASPMRAPVGPYQVLFESTVRARSGTTDTTACLLDLRQLAGQLHSHLTANAA